MLHLLAESLVATASTMSIVFIMLFLTGLMNELGLFYKISYLAKPLISFSHLPAVSASTFVVSLGSALAANTMIARMREEGSLTERQAFFCAIMNSVPVYFRELFTYHLAFVVPVLGLFIIALAYGAAGLDRKLAPSVFAVILILGISGMQIRHTLSNRFNGPMKEAVEALEVQPGDIFLHTDEHTIGTFSYCYPDHMNYYYISQGEGGFSNFDAFRPNGVVVRSLDEVPKDQRVWMVYRPDGIDTVSVPIWVRTGKLKVEGSPRAFRLPYSWYGFTVYKAAFAQTGSGAALPGDTAAVKSTGSGGD